MSGGPLGDSFNKGLHRGGSFDQGPPGGPPPNPRVGLYEWPTPDLKMFMPPWYPLVAIQFEPTIKFHIESFNFNIHEDTNPR